MAAIKRFFEKKKLDAKFKTAGGGQRLDASSSSQRPSTSSSNKPVSRQTPSQAAAQARDAAMARLQQDQQQQQKKPTSKTATWRSNSEEPTSSVAIDFENMKKEFREGAGLAKKSNRSKNESESHQSPNSSKETQPDTPIPKEDTQPYICPACGIVLPRNAMESHLDECLRQELESEPLMMSVTMIHSLNKDKEKVKLCVQTLSKYLQNIIEHPGEEKYRKIRQGNKVYQDKVAPIVGSEEFLLKGCGFKIEAINNDQNEEQLFYVLPLDSDRSADDIVTAKDMLMEAEPLRPILDRNMMVFEPSETANKISVPEHFYHLTRDEMKREQQNRTEQVEKMQQLRTKSMREGDNRRKHQYRYAMVRVRLPDGVILQGTFHGHESIDDVSNFLRESLIHDWLPFSLVSVIGESFESTSCSLNSLGLTPSVLFNMTIDADVTAELNRAADGGKIKYLKDEVLTIIQPLV